MVFIACGDRVEDNVTTALWLFDEPLALYPSSSMDDQTDNDNILTLGPGGKIVEGKFGNALEPIEQPKVRIPKREELQGLPDDKP